MSERFKVSVKDIMTKFSLIKQLVSDIDSKFLTEVVDQCNKEKFFLPMVDPTAYIKLNNKFYDEIKALVKLIKLIKDFKFHIYVK